MLLDEGEVVAAREIERHGAQAGKLDDPLVGSAEVVKVRDEVDRRDVRLGELGEDLGQTANTYSVINARSVRQPDAIVESRSKNSDAAVESRSKNYKHVWLKCQKTKIR